MQCLPTGIISHGLPRAYLCKGYLRNKTETGCTTVTLAPGKLRQEKCGLRASLDNTERFPSLRLNSSNQIPKLLNQKENKSKRRGLQERLAPRRGTADKVIHSAWVFSWVQH